MFRIVNDEENPIPYWMVKLSTRCPPSHKGSFQFSTIEELPTELAYGALGEGGAPVECIGNKQLYIM